MPASSDCKLKILCLHGYRQNAESFYSKIGAFRKIIKKYAELVVITAPLVVPAAQSLTASETDAPAEQSDQRGWWFSKPEPSFNAHDKTDVCYGFDESLNVIGDAFDKLGPFDGVLGFSQGAAMTALLSGLQQRGKIAFSFKFVIMFAGFKSGSTVHDACFDDKITCPSLHVIGEGDQVIPAEMSKSLLRHFEAPETLFHPGGHFVPAGAPQKAAYIVFLQKMISLCGQQTTV